MKKLLLPLIMILSFAGCKTKKNLAPPHHLEAIEGQYIVFMKESFDTALIQNRRNDPNRKKQKTDNDAARTRKQNKMKDFLRTAGIGPGKQKKIFADISISAIVELDTAEARKLKENANVEDVIQDITIQINPIQQADPSLRINPIQQWISDVINQINPIQQNDSIQNRYDIDTVTNTSKAILAAGGAVPGTGKTTVIWFLDTGIDTDNPNLRVDASLGAFFTGSSTDDDNGHGTFCAGAAAGTAVGSAGDPLIHIGVSEGATVVPVKVLDRDGKGSWGTVMDGLNHVAQLSQPGDVVNLSLGAYEPGNTNCYYPGIKKAIERITSGNVFVTLSAGNDAGNAECNRPGCINGINIFTASSMNADSTCAFYANFGSPVDFVTVGTRVFSLWQNGQYRMASGTSVSSAIMAGIIHARNNEPADGGASRCLAYRIARW